MRGKKIDDGGARGSVHASQNFFRPPRPGVLRRVHVCRALVATPSDHRGSARLRHPEARRNSRGTGAYLLTSWKGLCQSPLSSLTSGTAAAASPYSSVKASCCSRARRSSSTVASTVTKKASIERGKCARVLSPSTMTCIRRDPKGSEGIRGIRRDPNKSEGIRGGIRGDQKGSEGIRRGPKGSEGIRRNQVASPATTSL